MSKFHISPGVGPSPCNAEIKCRFGGEHFEDEKSAYDYYESTQGGSFQSGILSKDPIVTSLIPRDGQYKKYYEDTDKKHFLDKVSAGSKFTDDKVSSLEDVTALTLIQRGSLDGDDRDKLIALGGSPEAFGEDFRYLLVETPGKLGATSITSLPAGTQIKAMRTKTGGNVSLVAEVETQPTVNYGVVVMGSPPGVDKEIVITAHPGLPARYSESDTFASVEGKTITIEEAIRIAGTNDVNVNTRLKLSS